ncbi:tyrosine-type recombinase/integrase [Microbacterium rhizosphaerae]|uniref:Site-specific integrase n=1 Tax=Microbacterium rhizosphaerae TaxID=1678237 RepID=A0ABZ0SN83_9MICO|nr:site-specific integrase [Microbacterium rhizosphaerae]WPR89736.1 site-specific integrase [Microbacterium rhizosphaerae]
MAELAAERSASTVLRAHGVLSGILDVAVRDRRIPANPALGVPMPRKRMKRRVYLSHAQVSALAQESRFPELVYFLAYTGLRWGEATALRIRHIDLNRQRVFVEENAVRVSGKTVVGTPKTHVTRTVPIPPFLMPYFDAVATVRGEESLVFGDGTAHLILPNSKDGWFAAAVRRCQRSDARFPRVTPHDLRHTTASLAISSGANVKAVQRMLGHASAAMTLDTYADLFEDDLDAVSLSLEAARQKASAGEGWRKNVPLLSHEVPRPHDEGPAIP